MLYSFQSFIPSNNIVLKRGMQGLYILSLKWGSSTLMRERRYCIGIHIAFLITNSFLFNLLGWHWLEKPYRFQVCNSIKHHLHCIAHPSPHAVSFLPHFPPFVHLYLSPFPSGYVSGILHLRRFYFRVERDMGKEHLREGSRGITRHEKKALLVEGILWANGYTTGRQDGAAWLAWNTGIKRKNLARNSLEIRSWRASSVRLRTLDIIHLMQ